MLQKLCALYCRNKIKALNPQLLICPLDGLALDFLQSSASAQGHSPLVCNNGHSFDIARQGYINLLGVSDKRSKDPGDTKEMIAARSRILNANLYAPIAESLTQIVTDHLALTDKEIVVLDAGCGEGYYLEHCWQACQHLENVGRVSAIGLDISKWAIIAAAKRNSNITWLVASNRNPPIKPHSVDIIVCGFGFPDYAAFQKLLAPNGRIIMLDPAELHLMELRKVIYPSIKTYRANDFAVAKSVGWAICSQKNLSYTLNSINQQQIKDLLTMSPHLYKASNEGKKAALTVESMAITIDVNYTVLAASKNDGFSPPP